MLQFNSFLNKMHPLSVTLMCLYVCVYTCLYEGFRVKVNHSTGAYIIYIIHSDSIQLMRQNVYILRFIFK